MSNQTNYNTTVTTAPAPEPGIGYSPSDSVFNPGQPSNLTKESGNKTTRFFNNYFVKSSELSIQANDTVISFFEKQTGNRTSAKLLAQAVLNTATQQGDDPMLVIDEFRRMPAGELNAFLALYLNSTRVNTSLLGVTNIPQPNKYVARTIIK